MFPLNLLLELTELWMKSVAVEKLMEYAKSPTPDVQFEMPLVGVKVDIWICDSPKCKFAPKARRAFKITVDGKPFWAFYLLTQTKSSQGKSSDRITEM